MEKESWIKMYMHFLGPSTKASEKLVWKSGQIIATSAEVTLNGDLVRQIPPKVPSIQILKLI